MRQYKIIFCSIDFRFIYEKYDTECCKNFIRLVTNEIRNLSYKYNFPFSQILAVYALAYDAVIVYCEAMTGLMQKKETITADKLVAEIRKVRN